MYNVTSLFISYVSGAYKYHWALREKMTEEE
jgi:hypothetical protein